jgi:prepilin-type processing-associated H-X9-DG protein
MQVKCQHNLEQIGQACLMYASKNYGQYPKAWDMDLHRRWYDALLAGAYIDNPVAIGCPLEPHPPVTSGIAGSYEGREEVISALDWLKAKQAKTGTHKGRWNTAETGGSGHGTWPNGHDTGVSALALMAFLGHGCSDRYPTEYATTVDSAIAWLISQQDTSTGKFKGKFVDEDDPNDKWYLYDHAVATMAMCRAYMATGRSDTRESALRALNHLMDMQGTNRGQAWDYGLYHDDTPMTGWALQAIDLGRKAGLLSAGTNAGQIEESLKQMATWHATSYGAIYRYNNVQQGNHKCDQAMTAISMLSRLLMGHTVGSSQNRTTNEGRARGVLNYLQSRSDYLTSAKDLLVGGIRTQRKFYYYFYMTYVNSFMGGSAWEEWEREVWPHELLDGALTTQIGGKTVIYWPRDICNWGGYAGDVYTTAMACMALEVAQPGYWHPERGMGQCSYGYNSLVGDSRRNPSADTILAMDYDTYIIVRGIRDDAGNLAPEVNDADSYIALRHGGRANVLFADGTVRALGLSDLREGMWTPEPGD